MALMEISLVRMYVASLDLTYVYTTHIHMYVCIQYCQLYIYIYIYICTYLHFKIATKISSIILYIMCLAGGTCNSCNTGTSALPDMYT